MIEDIWGGGFFDVGGYMLGLTAWGRERAVHGICLDAFSTAGVENPRVYGMAAATGACVIWHGTSQA